MRDIKIISELDRVRKIKLWEDFKSFAFKGNMIDLAVAFVVGAAFSGVVKSMVDNIFMPIIGYIPLSKSGYMGWHIGHVMIGKFLGDLINFLLISFVVFIFVVKLMQALVKHKDQPAPAQATTKECPFCLSVIPIRASKCAHCTADLPEIEIPGPAATAS